MSDISDALYRFHHSTWNTVGVRRDKVTGCEVTVPTLQPLENEVVESRFSDEFPVLQYLDPALALAADSEVGHIASGFAEILGALRWSQNPSYNPATTTAEFLNGYAYAALSGPDAPIRCSVPRGGIMIMAPGVTYPGHKHEAREIYLILTPGSQWRLDEGEWFDVMPGDLIYHESWQIHSMRTHGEPLLAFAGWLETGSRQSIEWHGGA